MRKTLLGLASLLALLAVSEAALAHGYGRARVGVYIGGPYWGPYWGPAYYYPPPYYYYPPREPAQPTEYVERIDPTERGWWYYCEQSRAYYPQANECASGWKRVAPTPPPSAAPASSSPTAAPVPPPAPVPPAAPVPPMGPS